MSMNSLSVWQNGIRVGTWSVSSSQHLFTYDEAWITSPQSRPLSLSMPLTSAHESYRGERVRSFFDNLLPDSEVIRGRIKRRYRLRSDSPFDLLAQVGRDCVGAIHLLPPDEEPAPQRIEGKPLDDSEVAAILRSVINPGSSNTHDDEDFRLSLAGAQEKTALLFHDGEWHIPIGATPSTHIIKLPMGTFGPFGVNLDTSIENEWLCSLIAKELGLGAAHSALHRFEDQRVLVVERFDRRYAPDRSHILRLPQEDFCQATGTSPALKYESDGGPTMATIMDILLGSSNAREDREHFFSSQILFYLLAAPDGHAKNFSLFIESGGRFRLTPLYDVISAYPFLGKGSAQIAEQKLTMAMSFTTEEKHYKWNRIVSRHLIDAGRRLGLASSVESIISTLADKVPRALERVSAALPADFPTEVSQPILEGVYRQHRRLVDG
ncbi:MAG: type II toxin-antitoxin system HipA family toxin [Sphaerochaeta sp.]|jgi:serine/threonine-protein kinase HipA|nr:type II toxin-antitoxin system HipA family toxin [Sphaerochaeta sp.]